MPRVGKVPDTPQRGQRRSSRASSSPFHSNNRLGSATIPTRPSEISVSIPTLRNTEASNRLAAVQQRHRNLVALELVDEHSEENVKSWIS